MAALLYNRCKVETAHEKEPGGMQGYNLSCHLCLGLSVVMEIPQWSSGRFYNQVCMLAKRSQVPQLTAVP